MPKHLGLGPVFAYEWLMTTRRWQLYAIRGGFVAILLTAVVLVWIAQSDNNPNTMTARDRMAQFGESLFYAITGTQLTLVLLAAPAATAGAICLDKSRGALVHLLVTDLSDTEIVLGKLAARLAPILGLILASLPVLFFAALLGGIDLEALIGAYLIVIAVGIFNCTLALLLSIWGSKTHEVLLMTYMIVLAWILFGPVWDVLNHAWGIGAAPAWVDRCNPFWLTFAPYGSPGATNFVDVTAFFGGATGVAAILMLAAILCMRRVTVRQAGQAERRTAKRGARVDRPRNRWFGPTLDSNPVLWLEWHRRRPSRWMRIVWRAYAIGMVFFTLVALATLLQDRRFNELPVFVNCLGVGIGILMVSVISVTSLADERVRGSLDVLLTTPLPTASIVWGKWWGTYRVVPLIALLPGILAFMIGLTRGQVHFAVVLVGVILAHGAFTTSLGLALATWVRRFGRAVALSVGAYVFMGFGWLFLVLALFSQRSIDDSFLGPGLAMGSTWFSVAFTTATIDSSMLTPMRRCIEWDLGWIAVYSSLALILYRAVVGTFDWSMGRVTNSVRGQSISPPPKRTSPRVVLAGSDEDKSR